MAMFLFCDQRTEGCLSSLVWVLIRSSSNASTNPVLFQHVRMRRIILLECFRKFLVETTCWKSTSNDFLVNALVHDVRYTRNKKPETNGINKLLRWNNFDLIDFRGQCHWLSGLRWTVVLHWSPIGLPLVSLVFFWSAIGYTPSVILH